MKKLIAVMICAIFVLGMASYALADVTISGDARVRGVTKKNWDFDDDITAGNTRHWDQRFRINVDTNVDNVKAHMRFTVSEGKWGQNATYGNVSVHDDDLAYLEVPIGAFTIYAGRQHADWGHKFLVWNAGVDRFKVNYKISDSAKTGVFTTKKKENDLVRMDGDLDDYGFYFISSSDAFTGGLLLVHNVQSVDSTVTDHGTAKKGEVADFFFTAKTSAATIAGELAWKNGALNEETTTVADFKNGNSQYGGFLAAFFGNMHAAVAYARDGFVANKYFNPTLFIGKSQLTAMIDFNENIGISTDGTDTFAALFGAEFPLADATKGGARVAYMIVNPGDLGVESPDNTLKVKFLEVDLWAKYKVAETTDWIFEFGYLDPISGLKENKTYNAPGTSFDGNSQMVKLDDAAMVFVQRLEYKFK